MQLFPMDNKTRAEKDLKKLSSLIEMVLSLKLNKKYSSLFEHSLNYKKDAEHYYSHGDYFSSLGCANYAYGILEAILFTEKGKFFHEP